MVQTNLSKNFATLLKRLAHHDSQIAQNNLALQLQASTFNEQLSSLEQRLAEQTATTTGRMNELFRMVQQLEDRQLSLKDSADMTTNGVEKLNR